MNKPNSSSILKKNFDNEIIFHDDFDHEISPKVTINLKDVPNSPKYKTIPTKEGIFQNYQDTIEQINPTHPEVNNTLKNPVSEENMRSNNLLIVKKTQEVSIRAKNNSEYAPSYDPETQRVRRHRTGHGEKNTNEKLKEMVQQQIQERERWQQSIHQSNPNLKTIQSTHNNNLNPDTINDPESLQRITSNQKLGKLNDQKFSAKNLQKNHHFQQSHPEDGDYVAPIQKQGKQIKGGEQEKKKKNPQQIQALKKKASTYQVLNQNDMKSGSVIISLADKQTPSTIKPHIAKQSNPKFPQNSRIPVPKTRLIGVDIKDLSSFIRSPLPDSKYIQCNVHRECSCLSKAFFPEYSLQIDSLSTLHGKKTLKGYDIYFDNQSNPTTPITSMQKVATVKGNLLGNYYNIFAGQHEDEIIATVYYNSQMTTKSIVRDVEMYVKVSDITSVNDDSEVDAMNVFYSKGVDLKSLYGMIGQNSGKIDKFVSKAPNYDPQTKMYTLDFGTKKVTMPSVKNVILVNAMDERQRVLVFGKSGYDNFYLRIETPLSPIIAMGYLMTSFDFKWVTQ